MERNNLGESWHMYAAHHWIGIHASPSQLQSCEPFHKFHALPCFPQPLLQVCLAFSSKRQVQTFQSPPECSGAPLGFLEAGASNPCLAGSRRKPGKGTPVRVGNLPMKWECVHTKALTPGGTTILRGTTAPFSQKPWMKLPFACQNNLSHLWITV